MLQHRRLIAVFIVLGTIAAASGVAFAHNRGDSSNGIVLVVGETRRIICQGQALTIVPVDATKVDVRCTGSSTTTTSSPTTSPPTTGTPTSSTTAPSSTTTASTTSVTPLPGPGAGGGEEFGRFRIECDFSHRAQVDPIVSPGVASHHLHDFFGNTTVSANSTYETMLAGGTTCGLSADTAGYWAPTLVRISDGQQVTPSHMIIYYRNRPEDYGTTQIFPPNFRLVAGGIGTYPHAYWTCDGQSDAGLSTRSPGPPNCGSAVLKAHVFFPSCWDGVNSDSPNHRSHMAYAFDEDDGTSTDIGDDTCPASHPFKLPQLHLRVFYPVTNGTLYRLADGTTVPHMDFWNTWDQAVLEAEIIRCLRGGLECDELSD